MCYVSDQIAAHANSNIQATILAEKIENAAFDLVEKGYANINGEEIELSYVIENAIKDDNEQVLIELASLVASSANQYTSALKELLTPYAEIAASELLGV